MKQRVFLILLLSLFGAKVYAQNPFGNGLWGWMAITDASDLDINTQTFEAWINVNDLNGRIFSKGEFGEFDNDYAFSLDNGVLRFEYTNNFGEKDSIIGSAAVSKNINYHIALTISEEEVAFYINGKLDAKKSHKVDILHGHTDLFIMLDFYDRESMIDEVRIWDYARLKEQIVETMKDTLGSAFYSKPDSGLVGYWRCDTAEDVGDATRAVDNIRDFSAKENHSTFSGDIKPSNIVVKKEEEGEKLPKNFVLKENYPNPFNPVTNIEFFLAETADVRIEVYDITGRFIKQLVDKKMTAGRHIVSFNANDLSSGIYIYRLITPTGEISRKAILVK